MYVKFAFLVHIIIEHHFKAKFICFSYALSLITVFIAYKDHEEFLDSDIKTSKPLNMKINTNKTILDGMSNNEEVSNPNKIIIGDSATSLKNRLIKYHQAKLTKGNKLIEKLDTLLPKKRFFNLNIK